MESWRIFQRQAFQQFLRTRAFQSGPRQVRPQITPVSRFLLSTSRTQPRSLHTPARLPLRIPRKFPNVSRRSVRGFATASEAPTQHLSLSQRLKKLSREYGWTALGVYLFLSALDFPFCFLAVRLLGTDRIGHWEHVIVSTIKEWLKWPFSGDTQAKADDISERAKGAIEETMPVDQQETQTASRVLEEDKTYTVVDHGYREASAANKKADASIWTQLALAYAIHKSFIFLRVPLTAAVLPKVVKTLRSWGYNIGTRPAKKIVGTNAAGVNTKGSGVKGD